MNFGESALIQLAIALLGALFVFFMSGMGGAKRLFHFLILITPFQPLTSRYGSLNVGLVYVVGLSVYLNRSIFKQRIAAFRPLWFGLGFLGFVYCLALVYKPNPVLTLKLAYLFGMASNVVLFYLTTVFVKSEEDLHNLIKLVIISNGLVLAYCALQGVAGFTQFVPFGIQEFAFTANRSGMGGEDRRLIGPFMGAGIMSEYMVIMIYFLVYYYMTTKKYGRWIPILVLLDLSTMIATGNRGGFLVLICGYFVFAFMFRRMIGAKRIITIGIAGLFLLAVSSFIVVKYTNFDVLYERLQGTDVSEGVPDTRRHWPEYIEEAWEESPVLGMGIRLLLLADLMDDKGNVRPGAKMKMVRGYPHSLYIYIFYTLGVVGLFAWGVFVFLLAKTIRGRPGRVPHSPFLDGLPKVGLFILFLFAVDQLKIEFLRHVYIDYQNYLVTMMSIFLMGSYLRGKEIGKGA